MRIPLAVPLVIGCHYTLVGEFWHTMFDPAAVARSGEAGVTAEVPREAATQDCGYLHPLSGVQISAMTAS